MTILLSNDDGIDAPGMAMLIHALADEGDLAVVAPLRNRSGIGHAITFDQPVRVKTYPDLEDGTPRLAVDGTPADAVKFALKHHLAETPRLVVSGVNRGLNVGVNILYSGTLGAAFEAMIHGVDALAISAEHEPPPDPQAVSAFTVQALAIAHQLQARRSEGRVRQEPFCLNLNIPSRPFAEIRGLRVTRQGRSGFDEFFHADDNVEGEYHIRGAMRILDPDNTYDATAVEAGYASLTPLRIDFTDHALRAHMVDAEQAESTND